MTHSDATTAACAVLAALACLAFLAGCLVGAVLL